MGIDSQLAMLLFMLSLSGLGMLWVYLASQRPTGLKLIGSAAALALVSLLAMWSV